MLWDFYEFENEHGKTFKAYDPTLNGQSRKVVFENNPKHQRICTCQKCGIKIPREVPRIALYGSYYYGAGKYCISCGIALIEQKEEWFTTIADELKLQIKVITEIVNAAKKVLKHPFYKKHMALGKMFQVMGEEDRTDY